MRYFSHISTGYCTKNKLEEAVQAFIHTKNRVVIEPGKLPKFKEAVLTGISALNAQFKRCKPINAEWHKGYYFEKYPDYRLDLSSHIITFNVYAEKEVNV